MAVWTEDVRVAARTLARRPGLALIAVPTLALGIGANAAVFDLTERVVLRPPPYERPDGLILVWSTIGKSDDRVPVPAPDASVIEQRAASLAAVAFMGRSTDATLAGGDDDRQHHVVMAGVTPGYFEVLGVAPARGRGFLDEDSAPPTALPSGTVPPTVLVSNDAWRRVFGADPDLPGRTVRLNGRPVVVLGVLPADFRLELPPSVGIGTDVDVWVPIRVPLSEVARADGRFIDQDSDNGGAVVARLAAGSTPTRTQEELDRIAADLREEMPGYEAADFGLIARPLHADATAHARVLLAALLVGAVGLFLIACMSVAALLLARGMARQRELSVRAALGAGRGRMVSALLAESLMLLGAGGAAALPVAAAGGRALERLAPADLAAFARGSAGLPLTFVAAAPAAAGCIFIGLAVLQGGTFRAAPGNTQLRSRFGRARARQGLIVAEVAVSVVLLLGAGLLLRTAGELREVRTGFAPEGALVFDVSVRVAGAYTGPGERAELVRALERATLDVPGVRAVGLTAALPLSGRRWTQPFGLQGEAPQEWAARRADFRGVTSGYFDAVGTRVLQGRAFTPREDLEEIDRVVVVDETLARRIAPDGSAIGRTIGIPLDGQPVQARVVGVVEPVRHDDLQRPGREAIYVPYRQEASRDVSFVARTTGDPADFVAPVRRALLRVEPRLAIHGMRPMSGYVDAEMAPTRFGLALLSTYAVLGLLAAALGLYGVIAWEVGRRTRDLGVRMAVGATAAQVRASVLVEGVKLGALGVLAGTALAALAAGGLRRLVYGVGVADPATWAGVLAVVAAVTLLACWIPAARASRLDPANALRSE